MMIDVTHHISHKSFEKTREKLILIPIVHLFTELNANHLRGKMEKSDNESFFSFVLITKSQQFCSLSKKIPTKDTVHKQFFL